LLPAGYRYPVFLVGQDKCPQEIKDYLKGLALQKLYVFGGKGAISDKEKEEISVKPIKIN
jgi:hypothetical protein